MRSSSTWKLFAFLWLAFVLAGFMHGQAVPSVTFTLDFPGSDPSHYVISISSDNHASYQSNGRLSSKYASQEGEPFELTFTASPQLAQQIFALARKANYFQGEIETRKHGLASTGAKTLAYRDGERNTQAVYNYSPLVPVQELTRIFQSLSSTLEFGRRLEYCYRYQKLALDDELKNMEGFAKSGDLQDLSAVAPILQKIADDPSVINPVRYRARRLLAQAGSPPAGQ